jgi:ElaB/YqjD/DUF883 family membrane-anchored ribosome-binding protein
METTQSQIHGSDDTSSPTGPGEDRARDLGRRVDNASARVQHSWVSATSTARERIGSTGEQLKYRLQEAGEKAKQKLSVAKAQTISKAKDYKVGAEHKVQEHPIRSVAIAFGTGALVGLLLRRKRR